VGRNPTRGLHFPHAAAVGYLSGGVPSLFPLVSPFISPDAEYRPQYLLAGSTLVRRVLPLPKRNWWRPKTNYLWTEQFPWLHLHRTEHGNTQPPRGCLPCSL